MSTGAGQMKSQAHSTRHTAQRQAHRPKHTGHSAPCTGQRTKDKGTMKRRQHQARMERRRQDAFTIIGKIEIGRKEIWTVESRELLTLRSLWGAMESIRSLGRLGNGHKEVVLDMVLRIGDREQRWVQLFSHVGGEKGGMSMIRGGVGDRPEQKEYMLPVECSIGSRLYLFFGKMHDIKRR